MRKARLNFLARTDLVLHLFDRHTGDFVGSSGLHRINWDVRSFEIGYWISSSQVGQGLVTEAVNGITDFAINHLEAKRIEIRLNNRNIASNRVAELAGFTLEGVLRNESRVDSGEIANLNIYSKARGDEY